MRWRDRITRLPKDIANELDHAAELLVPYVDRVIHGVRSIVRHARREAEPRDQLYRDLGRRVYELSMQGDDRLRTDARVLELLATLARREAFARDLAAQQPAAQRGASAS